MKFKRHTELEKGKLDIVPLIDVVFLLLIFFMLTSSFIFQPGIKVNLPKAITSEVLHKNSLIIIITKDDSIYLDERVITVDELTTRLAIAAREDRPLLIKADRGASLGKVVEVWDLCREEGIAQINIATLHEMR